MKTSQVVTHFASVAKTAEFFNISRASVYQWLDAEIKRGKPLPREREYELNLRLPDVFPYRGNQVR